MAGDYLQQGTELIKGVERAVEEINQDGGILKKKVDLLKIDDQCSNSIAVSTAQMLSLLKNKEVVLVIGPYCDNSFAEITEIYAKARIVQIILTVVNYTQAKIAQKGLVKMLGYNDQEAKDFFAFYNTRFAGDKVALIYNEKNNDSIAEAQVIADEFQKHGKSIVLTKYTYQMTAKDYAQLAEKIVNDGAKMAFISGSSANIRKMALALRQEDEDFTLFTNKYAAGQKYFDALDEDAEGTYFMELGGAAENPEFTETLVKLRLSGFEPDGMTFYGYAALKLWKNLVQRAKSFDYDKLATVIKHKTVQTELGERKFYNGAPQKSEKYSIYRFENNGFNKVY